MEPVTCIQETHIACSVVHMSHSSPESLRDESAKDVKDLTHCCNVRLCFVKLELRQQWSLLHRRAAPESSLTDCSTDSMSALPYQC